MNGIAAAVAEDDKEEVNRLMYDAQEKIENLPDGMIGLSEMHDYGYRKDDVLPLTKEGAREWHRLGEKIYPLFRDGTAGDYVSQEGIEQHDGIFGIKADAWDAILLEQREDYAEDEYARPDFQLTVINREQALRLYDEGKQIYLVRISPWPILVTAREEIERGSDTFQIATADLQQERNMTEQENVLLYGSEKQLGIYQITARAPEHDYRFMGLDYVEKKGITVTRADYDLIYAAPLTERTRWMAFMNGSISSVRQTLRVIRCRSAMWWYSMMAVRSKPTMWTASALLNCRIFQGKEYGFAEREPFERKTAGNRNL